MHGTAQQLANITELAFWYIDVIWRVFDTSISYQTRCVGEQLGTEVVPPHSESDVKCLYQSTRSYNALITYCLMYMFANIE